MGRGSYTGWYRLCVAAWIMLGLAWMAGAISSLQEIYSDAIKRREERDKASTITGRAVSNKSHAGSHRSSVVTGSNRDAISIRSGSISSWSFPTRTSSDPPPTLNKSISRLDSIQEGTGNDVIGSSNGAVSSLPSTSAQAQKTNRSRRSSKSSDTKVSMSLSFSLSLFLSLPLSL